MHTCANLHIFYARVQHLRYIKLRAIFFFFFINSDFAIIIYIPQYEKHVNPEFSFTNVAFFIAANVLGMSIYNFSSNLNRLYIPKCRLSRVEKEALKWGDKANERSSMFDASIFHENKCLMLFKCHVALNNLHNC